LKPGLQIENKSRWGKNIFRWGKDKRTFGGQKYTKYNKTTIQKASEGARLFLEGLRLWPPLVAGLVEML